jgi:hypothetical protein
MKKRMIAALAGLMVLALGSVTVLAAPSTETESQKEAVKQDAEAVKEATIDASDALFSDLSVSSTISSDGTGTVETAGATIIVSEVQVDSELAALAGMIATEIIAEAEKQAQAEAEAKVSTLLANLGERQAVRTKKLAAFSLTGANLSAEQEAALKDPTREDVSIKLTFTVDGVTEGGSYVVMHYCSKHSKWESMTPVKVENGKITLDFHSFSPVIITEVYAADDENLGEGAGEGNGSTLTAGVTSPKTGETVPFAAVLSVALFAGAAVCAAKRVKFN